jgi:hypothetical protein
MGTQDSSDEERPWGGWKRTAECCALEVEPPVIGLEWIDL